MNKQSAAMGGSETSHLMTDFSLGQGGAYSVLESVLMVGALRLSTKDCSARAASGRF